MVYKQFRTKEQYPCPGSQRVSDARTWYTPPNELTTNCTICEECFDRYIKETENAINFGVYTHLQLCSCDYERCFGKTGFEQDNIKITVIDAKTRQKYSKVENMMANLNGVVHFVLPTCTEYMICIENLDNDNYSYYTFESGSVGDKKIVINQGKTIYYPSKLEIKGVETGTTDSFMFISQSNKERYEGYQLEGENVSNIIKIKIKKWRKEPYYQQWKREPSQNFYEAPLYCDRRFMDCRSDDSSFVNRPWSKNMSNNFSGGATVSGGSHVDDIKTTTTRDKFNQIGDEIEFVIQLVCDQDELEKYEANKKYYFKKKLDEKNKLIKEKKIIDENIKTYESQILYYTEKLENEKEKMDKLYVQLKAYDQLELTNKDDYLMKF